MAHEIDSTNGVNAIAYRGELPWHGLGQQMQEGEPLDQWRIRAGLNWTADKSPILFTPHGQGKMHRVEDRYVLHRSDTKMPLSMVSGRYQPVQPAEIIEFYRDLTERHGFVMETVGAIKSGKVVWALAKTGDVMRVRGNDVVKGYLLLSTSYDTSMATTGRFTAIRVVCNNTLSAAIRGRPEVSVPHSTVFNHDAAKVKLNVGDSFKVFNEQANALAERSVTVRESIDYFLRVYHSMQATEIVDAQAQKTTDATIARLSQFFMHGPGAELPAAKMTAWGLLNAVTFDVDHAAKARSTDNRLASAWYGRGAELKEKAREVALAMVA